MRSTRQLKITFYTCRADFGYYFSAKRFFFLFCSPQHPGKHNSDYPILSYEWMRYAVHNELRLQVTQFFSNCISFGAIWKHNLLEDLHGIEQNQCQLPGRVRFQYVKVSNMKPCISDLVQKKSQKVFK